MDKPIYLFYTSTQSFGVSVIIQRFLRKCEENGVNCIPITDLKKVTYGDLIIPYGIMEAWYLKRRGFDCDCVFLVDAISLGFYNMIQFLLKKGRIFNKEFIYSSLAYFKYRFEERVIVNKAKQIMVVSDTDAEYLKKISGSTSEFLVIPNGATLPEITIKTKCNHLRVGILSSWSSQRTLEENEWFIDGYFNKIRNEIPDIELILAGRGALIYKFENLPNIRVIGEVDDLNDFFKDVDVFLSVNPKGCGILNRVLDAFAYRTAVLGIKNSFSGFTYMSNNSYLSFSTYKEFRDRLIALSKDINLRESLINNAINDIKLYNNWDVNYNLFINKLFRVDEFKNCN